MPDDKNRRGPPDSKRINVNQKHEMEYWTEALGVTNIKLINLVAEYGTSVKKVREGLAKERKA